MNLFPKIEQAAAEESGLCISSLYFTNLAWLIVIPACDEDASVSSSQRKGLHF
jgi:hypothetical protein